MLNTFCSNRGITVQLGQMEEYTLFWFRNGDFCQTPDWWALSPRNVLLHHQLIHLNELCPFSGLINVLYPINGLINVFYPISVLINGLYPDIGLIHLRWYYLQWRLSSVCTVMSVHFPSYVSSFVSSSSPVIYSHTVIPSYKLYIYTFIHLYIQTFIHLYIHTFMHI